MQIRNLNQATGHSLHNRETEQAGCTQVASPKYFWATDLLGSKKLIAQDLHLVDGEAT